MTPPRTTSLQPVINETLQEYVFFNGALLESSHCRVSHQDRGLLYGHGLFETMRGVNGQVIRLERHLERLFHGADFLGIQVEMDFGYWTEAITSLLERNGLRYTDAYVRITLTGGLAAAALRNQPGNTLIVAHPLSEGVNRKRRGMKAFTLSPEIRRTLPHLKSLNYLPSIWGIQEAQRRGYDEALFVDMIGNVREGATTNIFAVRDGRLVTPPLEMGILPGITRDAIIRLASNLGMPVEYGVFNTEDLLTDFEGAFLTNALIDTAPITHLNGRPMPLSEQMRSLLNTLRLTLAGGG
jgi:branched-subunit amino acid aminotransferase/4-amino-4-deoxychorismate lyase